MYSAVASVLHGVYKKATASAHSSRGVFGSGNNATCIFPSIQSLHLRIPPRVLHFSAIHLFSTAKASRMCAEMYVSYPTDRCPYQWCTQLWSIIWDKQPMIYERSSVGVFVCMRFMRNSKNYIEHYSMVATVRKNKYIEYRAAETTR